MTDSARSLIHVRAARVAIGFLILLWSLGMSWLGYAVNNTYFPDFDKSRYLVASTGVVAVAGGVGGAIAFLRFGSISAGKLAIVVGLAILLVLWLRL